MASVFASGMVPLRATIIGGFKSSGELRTNVLGLPSAVIFYLMAQKHIIAGLTSGAVKG
jgi:hypothetical protein